MRALAANCTMIAFSLAGTFASLSSAQAQQLGVQSEFGPNPMRVQAAQFEEIVPAPAAELDIAPEISEAIGEVVAESNSQAFDAPPPPVNDTVVTDLLPPSAEPASILESPVMNETIIDPTFDSGQRYDIPIADVIPQETEVYSTNKWFRGGTWYSRQEFMMLLRADVSPRHFSVDTSPQTNVLNGAAVPADPFIVHSMSSQDGGLTYEGGTRLSLGKIIGRDVANRDHSIEFVFSGLFEHTGRAAIEPVDPVVALATGQTLVTGIQTLLGSLETRADLTRGIAGGFTTINALDGFTNSTRQEFLFESNLNSFEMNYVIGGRPARDRLVMQPDGRWSRFATPSKVRGFFMGLRYIRMNESLRVQGFGNNQLIALFNEDENGDITFTDGVADQIGTQVFAVDERGTYRVNTDNDLFGLQFGGDVVAKRTDWTFGVTGKFGGLLNFADRQSIMLQRVEVSRPATNNPNEDSEFETTTTREALDDETLTVLGELNVYTSYFLKPNTAIRVGYNVLYMNGVSAAMDNSGFVGGTFPKFELTGDAFYHGMNVGFETTW